MCDIYFCISDWFSLANTVMEKKRSVWNHFHNFPISSLILVSWTERSEEITPWILSGTEWSEERINSACVWGTLTQHTHTHHTRRCTYPAYFAPLFTELEKSESFNCKHSFVPTSDDKSINLVLFYPILWLFISEHPHEPVTHRFLCFWMKGNCH